MTPDFRCDGCGMGVWVGDAHYRTRETPRLCFLCRWVREFEPNPAKWSQIRAELDQE